ncbi:hypothetical protein F0562_023525 [Nyssa sinensis]|uniref:Uncharacterized protein n=1 Tax=Nyssa sinensis TaxID=561372 RepID=A0A5J5BHX3_9ASTE|nr:hypothetical protein F0562_023525 [Nyssa sinensis]
MAYSSIRKRTVIAFLSTTLSLKGNWGLPGTWNYMASCSKLGEEKKVIDLFRKTRMTAYFKKTGWPEKAPKSEEERKQFIASLHKRKTELFMALIEKKLLPLRPGVAKLMDQALAKGVKVAVCSTSNEKAIYAGDVVPRKKPDPAIYLLAASTLGVEPSSCVVVQCNRPCSCQSCRNEVYRNKDFMLGMENIHQLQKGYVQHH